MRPVRLKHIALFHAIENVAGEFTTFHQTDVQLQAIGFVGGICDGVSCVCASSRCTAIYWPATKFICSSPSGRNSAASHRAQPAQFLHPELYGFYRKRANALTSGFLFPDRTALGAAKQHLAFSFS